MRLPKLIRWWLLRRRLLQALPRYHTGNGRRLYWRFYVSNGGAEFDERTGRMTRKGLCTVSIHQSGINTPCGSPVFQAHVTRRRVRVWKQPNLVWY